MSDTPKKFAVQVVRENGETELLPGLWTIRAYADHAAGRFAFATSGKERYEVVEVEG